jgi:hypothetical protein
VKITFLRVAQTILLPWGRLLTPGSPILDDKGYHMAWVPAMQSVELVHADGRYAYIPIAAVACFVTEDRVMSRPPAKPAK